MNDLEQCARLQPPRHDADFPSRLDHCLRTLKRKRFQAAIRERTLAPLARNLLEAQETLGKELPSQARELASLGSLANPIVNFNVETLTSCALAGPGGPWRPLPFRPPALDQLSLPRSDRESSHGKRFQRHVYHPHGVIDLVGLCALARSDYQAMQGTLSLELATHAAFGLNLAIVGMSLDDDYLRKQIERFRGQIRDVFFFTDRPPKSAIGEWAWRSQVQSLSYGEGKPGDSPGASIPRVANANFTGSLVRRATESASVRPARHKQPAHPCDQVRLGRRNDFFEKGRPTRKVWFYQLDPGGNLGKTDPLHDDGRVDFIDYSHPADSNDGRI